MSSKNIGMSEAIGFGWETVKKNILFFIGVLIVYWAVSAVPQFIGGLFQENAPALSLIFQFIAIFAQMFVYIGLIKITLQFCDGRVPEFSELFSNAQYFLNYFLASLLVGLIILGGTILFIIPGIIFSIKLQFVAYLIVDKNMAPVDAIKRSWEMTKGVKWQLFLFGLLLFLINLLGVLALCIGIFVTTPLTLVALAYVYRKLEDEGDSGQMLSPQA